MKIEEKNPNIIKKFEDWMTLKHYSESTIISYSGCVKSFLYFHNSKEAKKINRQQIIEYLVRYKNSSTYNHIKYALQMFYADIVKQPKTGTNAFELSDKVNKAHQEILEALHIMQSTIENFDDAECLQLNKEQHYGYIEPQISSKQIESFLAQDHIKDLSIERQANLFQDYLLANGLADVQE